MTSDDFTEDLFSAVPNLRALHADTVYQVYREYIMQKDLVEITIFYREPGEDKKRIDVEYRAEHFLADDLKPDYFRITYWGSAVKI